MRFGRRSCWLSCCPPSRFPQQKRDREWHSEKTISEVIFRRLILLHCSADVLRQSGCQQSLSSPWHKNPLVFDLGKRGTTILERHRRACFIGFFLSNRSKRSILLPQQILVSSSIVLPCQAPVVDKCFAAYCARLAKDINPRCRCIVGSASFGGIVAIEMATQLNAVVCILSGRDRFPADISSRIRARRILSPAFSFCLLGHWNISQNWQSPFCDGC